MSNENSGSDSKITLAKWTDRFLAWLIDFIIISSISTMIIFLLFGTIYYEFDEDGLLTANRMHLIIAKYRHGAVGVITCWHSDDMTKIGDESSEIKELDVNPDLHIESGKDDDPDELPF